MPKIVLNGLSFGSGEGQRKNISKPLVAVYLSRKYNTEDAELLFEASPDSSGMITQEISDEFIGERITIVLCDLKFKPQNIEKLVDELGTYYTFNLEKDFCYNGSGVIRDELEKVNTHAMHSDGQDLMHDYVRSSKYHNKYIKYGSLLITFVAPFLGLVWGGVFGVIIGLGFSALLYFLTPYINGDKKWKSIRT